MPISSKDMKKRGAHVQKGKTAHRQQQVIAYLAANKDKAYTQTEVGDEFNITGQAARGALIGLEKKGITERRVNEEGDGKIYWMLTDAALKKIADVKPAEAPAPA